MPALSGADCRGCGAGEELHPSLSPGHTSSGGCGRALALRRMACLAACRRIPNPQERDARVRSTDRSRRAAPHACIAWRCAALILHRFLLLWCDDCPPLYGGGRSHSGWTSTVRFVAFSWAPVVTHAAMALVGSFGSHHGTPEPFLFPASFPLKRRHQSLPGHVVAVGM